MLTFNLSRIGVFLTAGGLCSLLGGISVCAEQDMNAAARDFIRQYETNVVPLEITFNRAWWEANTTGSEAAFSSKKSLDMQLNELLSSSKAFEQLTAIDTQQITEPQLARQIEILRLIYLNRQGDLALLNRMSAKANDIEQKFNQFSRYRRRRLAERQPSSRCAPHVERLLRKRTSLESLQRSRQRRVLGPARARANAK